MIFERIRVGDVIRVVIHDPFKDSEPEHIIGKYLYHSEFTDSAYVDTNGFDLRKVPTAYMRNATLASDGEKFLFELGHSC